MTVLFDDVQKLFNHCQAMNKAIVRITFRGGLKESISKDFADMTGVSQNSSVPACYQGVIVQFLNNQIEDCRIYENADWFNA